MDRRSRKGSSSAGSEKMERVGDRYGKMERYCLRGQSPQRAVEPTEEKEEEEEVPEFIHLLRFHRPCLLSLVIAYTYFVLATPKSKSTFA
jgi:hypothetical protein